MIWITAKLKHSEIIEFGLISELNQLKSAQTELTEFEHSGDLSSILFGLELMVVTVSQTTAAGKLDSCYSSQSS